MSHIPRVAIVLAIAAASALVVVAASCRRPVGGHRPGASTASAAKKANARCYECHIDFVEEGLTHMHEKAGVTCARCHGLSQPHIDDEVRATKADATFRGPAMKVFCFTCHSHDAHRTVAAHVANRALEPQKRRQCTACHGDHKLVDDAG